METDGVGDADEGVALLSKPSSRVTPLEQAGAISRTTMSEAARRETERRAGMSEG